MDWDMEDGERFLSSLNTDRDGDSDNTLRPKTMSDYVGQDKIKHNLSVYIEAAKGRGEPLDHVLLYGPPGLGKTTLAHIIAGEMNSHYIGSCDREGSRPCRNPNQSGRWRRALYRRNPQT